MPKKPRMGSDPLQKKDPLGWIGSNPQEKAETGGGALSQQSSPRHASNTGNQSKQDLSHHLSAPGNSGTSGGSARGTTTSKGLRPGWTRATFIVRDDLLRKLKQAAYWERKELKRVLDEALTAYLLKKDFPPIPRDDVSQD